MGDKIEQQLRRVAMYIEEKAPSQLGQRIKARIPSSIHGDHDGKVNIVVHLRISRLTAMAAIVATVIGCAFLFSGLGTNDRDLYGDLKTLVEFLPGKGNDRASMLNGFQSYYQKLVDDGYETVYFGERADPKNSSDILIYWRLEDGRYRVIFADFRNMAVSSEGLIFLQSCMLKGRDE